MKPDFKNIDIKSAAPKEALCGCKTKAGADEIWKTPEHIEVKPVYTKEDLEGMEHLNYAAGDHVCDASLDHPSVCRILHC